MFVLEINNLIDLDYEIEMELINIAILYHVLKVNKWSTDVQF